MKIQKRTSVPIYCPLCGHLEAIDNEEMGHYECQFCGGRFQIILEMEDD